MWNNILSVALCSKKQIILNVASSGIVSLLLPRGRTTHSKFKILVPIISICKIDKKDEVTHLLRLTYQSYGTKLKWPINVVLQLLTKVWKILLVKLIMVHRNIFREKSMYLVVIFRQILHVILRGRRYDIIHATINTSYI